MFWFIWVLILEVDTSITGPIPQKFGSFPMFSIPDTFCTIMFDKIVNLVPSVETHVNHLCLGFHSLGLDPTVGEGRNEDGPIDREPCFLGQLSLCLFVTTPVAPIREHISPHF